MLPKAYWSDFESKGLMWKTIVYWKEIFDRKLTSFFRLQWEHRFGFPFAHLKIIFFTLALIYSLYFLANIFISLQANYLATIYFNNWFVCTCRWKLIIIVPKKSNRFFVGSWMYIIPINKMEKKLNRQNRVDTWT